MSASSNDMKLNDKAKDNFDSVSLGFLGLHMVLPPNIPESAKIMSKLSPEGLMVFKADYNPKLQSLASFINHKKWDDRALDVLRKRVWRVELPGKSTREGWSDRLRESFSPDVKSLASDMVASIYKQFWMYCKNVGRWKEAWITIGTLRAYDVLTLPQPEYALYTDLGISPTTLCFARPVYVPEVHKMNLTLGFQQTRKDAFDLHDFGRYVSDLVKFATNELGPEWDVKAFLTCMRDCMAANFFNVHCILSWWCTAFFERPIEDDDEMVERLAYALKRDREGKTLCWVDCAAFLYMKSAVNNFEDYAVYEAVFFNFRNQLSPLINLNEEDWLAVNLYMTNSFGVSLIRASRDVLLPKKCLKVAYDTITLEYKYLNGKDLEEFVFPLRDA